MRFLVKEVRLRIFGATVVGVLAAGLLSLGAVATAAAPAHGISMHGDLRHAPDFKHFDYANPDAPKGGRLTYAAVGSFDSLNPFIVKGVPAAGVRNHVFESLMARGYDEPFSLYGLIAETIETPDDRSWVEFALRPEARFSDGYPITVDDVVFSLELLRENGRPNHRFYYSKVERVERPGEGRVRFHIGPETDREMPLILGLMPILPAHIYADAPFGETTLDPMIGSGPYTISTVDPGTRISYRRNPDYWGADLAVNRGRFNANEIVYDYYRDTNASFEAFKAGLYDVRPEADPTRWTQTFDFPAVRDGRVVKEEFSKGTPAGMRAMVFNTRRSPFDDRRVRQALALVFDFEWINKTFYHGVYTRTQSFYDGSELSSHGRPASQAERVLLAGFPGAVEPDILEEGFLAPVSDGTGRNRSNRRAAVSLLKEAGFSFSDQKMVDGGGEPLAFEILIASPEDERIALTYSDGLARIGVTAKVRMVDSAQYQQRRQTYDYDMIFNYWYASLSPGNEQSFYWGSDAATQEGTRNYMGVAEPAVDAMIEAMLEARDRDEFVDATRALDRVLLSGDYVIPLFHLDRQWIARWTRVKHPDRPSLYGYRSDTWWIEE